MSYLNFLLKIKIMFGQEQLLEKVWGYDYFGGARTVDVVLKPRAKPGDKRQDWIKTVHKLDINLTKTVTAATSSGDIWIINRNQIPLILLCNLGLHL